MAEAPKPILKDGELIVEDNVLYVAWRSNKTNVATKHLVQAEMLSKALQEIKNASLQKLNKQPVSCELTNGQLTKIGRRIVQQAPKIPPSKPAAGKSPSSMHGGRGEDSGHQSSSWPRRSDNGRKQESRSQSKPYANDSHLHQPVKQADAFENPYNFVPAPPRPLDGNGLSDAPPVGHHRYHSGHWSGRIDVELTTITPLLIPDNGTENNGHKTFGIRLDNEGKPYLPPTSIKGMLRSAYEAVTNSRMGVYKGYPDSFGYWKWVGRPVRESFNKAPDALLPVSIKPANDLGELSPADRVFGWVRAGKANGTSVFKGQLRIGAVSCDDRDAVVKFGNPVPLAILGAPKPAQARFYAAKDANGTPLDKRSEKNKGYAVGGGLRGRKVYPHHALAAKCMDSYWQDNGGQIAAVNSENGSLYREWSRPEVKRRGHCTRTDDQNRSLSAWVRPGAKFKFTIEVTNLSAVELGALFWLLNLPEEHYLRLGGGKPLGFGSVRLCVTAVDVKPGEAIADIYKSFGDTLSPTKDNGDCVSELIHAYKQACMASYPKKQGGERNNMANATTSSQLSVIEGQLSKVEGDSQGDAKFADIGFIKAFLNSAKGGNLPVHYPRKTVAPNPEGKNFEWFVANEKSDKRSLPALTEDDRGLPISLG